MLGDGARAQKVDPAKVCVDVRERYAQDYEKQWSALLSDIRLARSSGLAQTIEQAKILSAPDSPLKRLVAAASKELSLATTETRLSRRRKGSRRGLEVQPVRQPFLRPRAGARLAAPRPEDAVDVRFAPLRTLVAQQGQAAPRRSTRDAVDERVLHAAARCRGIALARTGQHGALRERLQDEGDADRYPEPVRTVLRDLAQTSSGQAAGAAQENIKRAVSGSASFCAKAIAGKYPFAKSAATCCSTTSTRCSRPAASSTPSSSATSPSSWTRRPDATWRARPGMEASAPTSAHHPAVPARGGDPRQLLQARRAAGAGEGGRAADLGLGRERALLRARRKSESDVAGQRGTGAVAGGDAGAGAKIAIAGAPAIAADGPWALFRVFDKGTPQAGAQPGLVRLAFAPDANRRATLELQPTSVNNPFQSRELHEFQCPGQKESARPDPWAFTASCRAWRFPEPAAGRASSSRPGTNGCSARCARAARRSASAGWNAFFGAGVALRPASGGVYSDAGLVGLLAPSVDRVRTLFPAYARGAAAPAGASTCPPRSREPLPWLDSLEALALDALRPELDFDAFDQRLAQMPLAAPGAARAAPAPSDDTVPPGRRRRPSRVYQSRRTTRKRRTVDPRPDRAVRAARVLRGLADRRARNACRHASRMRRSHSGERFCAMLDGRWHEHSWTLPSATNVNYCAAQNPRYRLDSRSGQGAGDGEIGPLIAPPSSADGADMNTGLEK